MINGTNVLRDDNPRWASINLSETPATRKPPLNRTRRRLATIGNWLFAANDAEARWRGWQIIERHGGLGRRYRDLRFGKSHQDSR